MKNALLIAHTITAITTATIFLFQIATLVTSISAYFEERIVLLKGRRRTYGAQSRRRRQRGPGMREARRVIPGS
jgi:hypothetical protein